MESINKIARIRSGGQSGVDRAALDVANEFGIPICGWCPKGGWAEDYPDAPGLLMDYPELTETPLAETWQRTTWNMRDTDAILTIIPKDSAESKGTNVGLDAGEEMGKPMLTVSGMDDIDEIMNWISGLPEGTEICVGGPRASECARAYEVTKQVLTEMILRLKASDGMNRVAYYHLPGLFEFYELYRKFLPLYYGHREWFYEWCEIGSIYGAPTDCLWGGGRVEYGEASPGEVLALMQKYGISARLTLSNSLVQERHLTDWKCNELCRIFAQCSSIQNGAIVHSELLLDYLKKNYPEFYFVSSTTKVLTEFEDFVQELDRKEFRYVVPDFRLNKSYDQLRKLTVEQRNKVEFLCNECCWIDCYDRKNCYENVSRLNLGEDCPEHICVAPHGNEGYRFSKAMKNPAFISVQDIQNVYLPMGFSNFKIEGRGLGSALILEFLLYYMTKPQYQLEVREEIYLDNMLDLF